MKWLASIKNPNWFVPYPRSVVCSKHFDDDDYKINVWGHKKLKINAIPKSTINRQFLLNGKNKLIACNILIQFY
jgi:hypothetical protein